MMNNQPELSPSGRKIMSHAKQIACDYLHDFITTEHILLSIFEYDKLPSSVQIMRDIHSIDIDSFRSFVISNLKKYKGDKKPKMDEIEPSGRVLTMVSYAASIAHEMDSTFVSVDHMLLSILVSDSGTGNNLFKLKNIDVDVLYEDIYSRIVTLPKRRKRKTKQKTSSSGGGDEEMTSTDHKESVIEKYATNLTRMAYEDQLDPVIGREDDVRYMLEILSRRTKNNPVLVGEPGVGKTAVVELLAQRIVSQQVPINMFHKQIYSLDLAQLVAGTIYRGQFEERLKEVINYAQQQPDIILFIDELHMLVGAGSTSGSMDASNILKPALARGKISCIGATTLQEYKEFIESDGALDRRFQNVYVDEPTQDETLQILRGIKHKYETYHNVKYNLGVLREIVDMCNRYLPDKRFPDKAIDILDEVGARIKVRKLQPRCVRDLLTNIEQVIKHKNIAVESHEFDTALGYRETEQQYIEELNAAIKEREDLYDNPGKAERVDIDHVRSLVSDRTGVPVNNINRSEADVLRDLACNMKKQVIGQEAAIDTICSAIKRSRAGLTNPDRPICSLLFLGPTGVGKTHLARILGTEMFSDGNFKQYDMSEFSEKHSVSKLIGSPPGYVGSGEGGDLTEFIRHNPYSVLLLDEIEKAHPDVLQVFLQVLEYGCLTDSDGLSVNFKNTIIVMTSNVGAHKFDKLNTVGFTQQNDTHTAVIDELRKMYAPEFINRLDNLIVFDRLNDDELTEVAKLLLRELRSNARSNNGCMISYSGDVCEFVARANKQHEYGARPLRRVIVDQIETPLAEMLIDSPEPINKIKITVDGEKLLFTAC
jgi:ATP-dependent Clp protease ATP-binding subunit ClpC